MAHIPSLHLRLIRHQRQHREELCPLKLSTRQASHRSLHNNDLRVDTVHGFLAACLLFIRPYNTKSLELKRQLPTAK